MKFRRQAVFLFIIAALDLCLAVFAVGMWRQYYGGGAGDSRSVGSRGGAGYSRNVDSRAVGSRDSEGEIPGEWSAADPSKQPRPVSADGPAPEPKAAALTFDDGPNVKYTEKLLDGLKERDVKATFFLVGECIEGNEDLVKRIDEDGHLIGVHCMHHTDLTKEELAEANRELEETRAEIYEITGKNPEYVRPPYGKWSDELLESVDMVPIFWNVDSIDWKLKNTKKIVKKVLKDTDDGDIILMHDEFSTSVEAALEIIDNLHAKGYTFVTVDELSVD